MKKVFLFSLAIALCMAHTAVAQSQKFSTTTPPTTPLEIGVALGTMSYEGDVNDPTLANFKEMHISGGLFVRKHLSDHFAVRGNLLFGKISGKDANFTDPAWRKQRNYKFTSPVTELSGQLEWNILGNHRAYTTTSVEDVENGRRYTRYTTSFKRTLLPYLFAGGGAITTNPTTNFNTTWDNSNTPAANMKTDIADGQGAKTRFGVHAGAGINAQLAPNWILGAELGFRTAFTDYFDGISATGNAKKNDWYLFGGLNLAYRLSKNNNKDTDGDGIPDKLDACPDAAGKTENHGCPIQADKVSVVKAEQPVIPTPVVMTPVVQETQKVIEKATEVVESQPVVRTAEPTVEVVREVVKVETVTPTSSTVVLEKSEETAFNYAFKGVQFETSKAVLLTQSYSSLNNIVKILKKYPTYTMRIEGNTDNQGNEAANQSLSQRRAEACLAYLAKQGIDANRLSAFGLGSTQPIAANNTLEGRQKNRRVEFKLAQ
jgi:outer membrane protein OmpA-like peptidoglycan-associated protein/opacity protein-like surface antigen